MAQTGFICCFMYVDVCICNVITLELYYDVFMNPYFFIVIGYFFNTSGKKGILKHFLFLFLFSSQNAGLLTSRSQTQAAWKRAEWTLATRVRSVTSHTNTLWSAYTQLSQRLMGSYVTAVASG